MTPPALMDFSTGTAVLRWDMSTLRTAARDWVDIVFNPYNEHQELAYNNNDQHVPPDNVHIQLAGGGNVFLATQRTGGGSDVSISGDTYTTWDMVQQANGLSESPQRRDTFEIDLSSTHLRMCIVGNNTSQTYTYQGQQGFCWVDHDLPTPLSSSVWQNQAQVQLDHRNYNTEKSCAATDDQFGLPHDAQADQNCPPDTWHWANVSISPAVSFSIIKPSQDYDLSNPSPQTVTFQQPAPPNTNLEFVTFGTNSQLQVSFDNGNSWQTAHFQPATATGHDENGEMVWMPMPQGLQSVMVRGANGFWGSYNSFAFNLFTRSAAANPGIAPTGTPTPPPSLTATPTASSSSGQTTLTFDDLSNPNRPLTGQYPSGVADWGGGTWWLSGPYDQFTSNSVSFNGSTPTSATISFLSPRRLVTIDADNGGTSDSTLSFQCPGQPTLQGILGAWLSGPYGKFTSNSVSFNGAGRNSEAFNFVSPRILLQLDMDNGGNTATTVTVSCAGLSTLTVNLAPGQLATGVQTGWTKPCTTVTILEFERLVHKLQT